MLTHPTVDKLHELRCLAMARALTEQLASPQVQNLSFEERLGLLVCCFSRSVVESPRQLVAVFRSRISWDDGAIRERAGAVAFLMNRCCRSGEAVGARAPSVGKRWGSEASPWLVHTARRAALGPQDASTS